MYSTVTIPPECTVLIIEQLNFVVRSSPQIRLHTLSGERLTLRNRGIFPNSTYKMDARDDHTEVKLFGEDWKGRIEAHTFVISRPKDTTP